jgi:hypothetical protein
LKKSRPGVRQQDVAERRANPASVKKNKKEKRINNKEEICKKFVLVRGINSSFQIIYLNNSELSLRFHLTAISLGLSEAMFFMLLFAPNSIRMEIISGPPNLAA